MDIFTERLNEAIKESNLMQKEIAEKANLSKQAITDFKKGRSYPNIQTLRILSTILNVTSDYLLGLEDYTGRKTYIKNSYNTINGNNNRIGD